MEWIILSAYLIPTPFVWVFSYRLGYSKKMIRVRQYGRSKMTDKERLDLTLDAMIVAAVWCFALPVVGFLAGLSRAYRVLTATIETSVDKKEVGQ